MTLKLGNDSEIRNAPDILLAVSNLNIWKELSTAPKLLSEIQSIAKVILIEMQKVKVEV